MFFGTVTVIVTNWSPRPLPLLCRYGMPLPRRRNTLPGCVPSGMVSLTRPSMVGTSISAPSAAWANDTGISMSTELPSRSKSGCGLTKTVMSRSPAGPPSSPALPLPRRFSVWPSSMPAGILTLMA